MLPVINGFLPVLFLPLAVVAAAVSKRRPGRMHAIAGVLAALLFAVYLSFLFIRTRAELLGVGLLFVPFFAAAYGLGAAAVSWATVTLLAQRYAAFGRRGLVAMAVLVAALVLAVRYCHSEFVTLSVQRGRYTPEELRSLARSSNDAAVLSAVARQRATPADALRILAERSDGAVRRAPTGVRSLLHQGVRPVLAEVALNPATPTDALQRLAQDRSTRINFPASQELEHRTTRSAPGTLDLELATLTAADARTSPESLTALAGHAEPDIRARVAGNANTPLPVLLRLLNDSNAGVRLRAAQNPHVPPAMLSSLSADEDRAVRDVVQRRLRAATPPRVK